MNEGGGGRWEDAERKFEAGQIGLAVGQGIKIGDRSTKCARTMRCVRC